MPHQRLRVRLNRLYIGGLLLVAARFVAGGVRTFRQARPAPYGRVLADTVRGMLESPGAAMPMTWGMLRPIVLLPEAARRWPVERLYVVVRMN